MDQPKVCLTKSTPFLVIKKELWWGRSSMPLRHWSSCSRSSNVRLLRSSVSLISSEKVRSRLKCIPSRRPLRCQRAWTRKGRSRRACFRRYCNSWVSKMKLFRATRTEIHKAYLWDKCRPTIFKRSFSIKTTSSSPKWGKQPKRAQTTTASSIQ